MNEELLEILALQVAELIARVTKLEALLEIVDAAPSTQNGEVPP